MRNVASQQTNNQLTKSHHPVFSKKKTSSRTDVKGWRNLIQAGRRSLGTGVAPWLEIFLKIKKRGACIIKQALCSDRRESQYWQLASCCRIHMVSVACSPANPNSENYFFFPLSHIAKFLAVLSIGGKVTRVKAVAGRTSHASKAHSQWLLHTRFSSWMKSSRGRLVLRRTSTPCLQQGRDIKVGVI